MPLHDWTDRDNFDGLHHLWIAEVVRELRHSLSSPYRVVLGTSPLLALGGSLRKRDAGVTHGRHAETPSAGGAVREPDTEVTVATLEEDLTAQVVRDGRLVAVIEFISPRNNDSRTRGTSIPPRS